MTDQLRAYLRRLSLEPHLALPSALQQDGPSNSESARAQSQAISQGSTLDAFLSQCVRTSYLERVKPFAGNGGAGAGAGVGAGGTTQSATQGRNRTRARRGTRGGAEGEEGVAGMEVFEWRWGARAEAEVGEKAVAMFIGEVFHGRAPGEENDEEEDEEERERTRRQVDGSRQAAFRNGATAGAGASASGRMGKKEKETQLLKEIERAAGSQLFE